MSASPHLAGGRMAGAAGGPAPLPDITALTGPDGAFRLWVPGASALGIGATAARRRQWQSKFAAPGRRRP